MAISYRLCHGYGDGWVGASEGEGSPVGVESSVDMGLLIVCYFVGFRKRVRVCCR